MSRPEAPAQRFSPAVHRRINQIRLWFDVTGVTVVRFLLPLVHAMPAALFLNIYNVLAWVTILTLDSARLPEFTTTRVKQRQAWWYALKWVPLLSGGMLLTVGVFHLKLYPTHLSATVFGGILLQAFMDELLFRNVLQPTFRKLGMSRWGAIFLQALLFSTAMYSQTHSLGLMCSAILIGVFNGWMVYRYRSLWPAAALSLIWRVFLV